MIVSLTNGKVMQVTCEMYLQMTDDDFQYLLSLDWGDHIEDPFHHSMLREQSVLSEQAHVTTPEDTEDAWRCADQLSIEEKLELLDYDTQEE